MSVYGILTILHIIGAAVGVGAATASDSVFMRAVRNRLISTDQFVLIRSVSHVVQAGLSLVVLTGIGLLLYNPSILQQTFFQAKMVAVTVLILNAFVFHAWVMRFLARQRDVMLTEEVVGPRLWLLAGAGAVSVVSWFAPLIVILAGRTGLGIGAYLALYAGALIIAVAVAYLLLSHLLLQPREAATPAAGAPERQGRTGSAWTIGLLAVLLFAFLVTLFVSAGQVGTVHTVRITEAPAWFEPDVLRIEPGDRVTWTHRPEQAGVPATHPVHLVDGPRFFSSNMRPVGHEEDGWGYSVVFSEPGIYEYVCPTHPYMRGIVAVGVDPPQQALWPPEERIPEGLSQPPEQPGIGEIWLNAQFEVIDGQPLPGTILVINAETWEMEQRITDPTFNNPHNFRPSYDGRFAFQTQWHDEIINKIDRPGRAVLDSARVTGAPHVAGLVAGLERRVGTAPAHVFVDPHRDLFYLTLNNDGRVFVMDFELNIVEQIRVSFGAHGIWVDPSGRWMSVAATLDGKLDIIDLDTRRVVATFEAPGLPLATEITYDGRYAMISLLLEGVVRFIDLETLDHVTDVEVGEHPVWPRPAPDGQHVYVPNTGSADISIISLETLEVVKTIPAANGAHGITFCPNRDGGWYGYVSNKFARTITVVDAEAMETVGSIPLPETAWGGQGIHCFPGNAYDQAVIAAQQGD